MLRSERDHPGGVGFIAGVLMVGLGSTLDYFAAVWSVSRLEFR